MNNNTAQSPWLLMLEKTIKSGVIDPQDKQILSWGCSGVSTDGLLYLGVVLLVAGWAVGHCQGEAQSSGISCQGRIWMEGSVVPNARDSTGTKPCPLAPGMWEQGVTGVGKGL